MAKINKFTYILSATGLMTLQPVLVTLSKVDGKLQYEYISTTILSEVIKLAISLALLSRVDYNSGELSPPKLNLLESLRFAVPAFIYFINNNLVFVTLQYLDATTFQLCSSLKTVFTGILFRVFLQRELKDYQWIAILLLACGTSTSQLGLLSGGAQDERQQSQFTGVSLMLLSCLLSAFGGIFSEFLLKKDKSQSIHWQNVQLYVYGVGFNTLGLLGRDVATLSQNGILGGYNIWTWTVVLNNAFNGLAISAILKYTDNIVRVYAHAVAMLLTMLIDILLFSSVPSPQLVIAIVIVSCSTYLYNLKLQTIPVGGRPPLELDHLPDHRKSDNE